MGEIRKILLAGAGKRTFRHRSTRPTVPWREAVDGRAPRLDAHQYIGHDIAVATRGAWAGRDPLVTPKLWSRYRWGALVGWVVVTGGAGFVAWRQHGGKEGLFGPSGE